MKIMIYEKEDCSNCKRTKAFLDKHNVSYNTAHVTEMPEELWVETLTAPRVVVTNGQDTDTWQGFRSDKLKALVDND